MKKASRILFIVAAVLAFVTSIDLLFTGIIFLIFYAPFREFILTLAEEAPYRILKEILLYFYRSYMSTMITYFIYSFLNVFYGIILLTTLNVEHRRMYIFKIIIGALMSTVGLVGAILGLIAFTREERRKKVEAN